MRECMTISFFATVLISTLGMAATDASNPIVASYDLDVTFSPDQRSLSGTATIRFDDTADAPPQVGFDLHGELEVDSVAVGESPAEFLEQKVFDDREYSLVGMTSEDWNGFAESFINQLTLAHELVDPFVQLKTGRDDRLYAMGIEGGSRRSCTCRRSPSSTAGTATTG
jgi:aminopeptidase N